MERKLKARERANLIQKHKVERDKRVCDRIKAVLAFDDGYNYSEIARLLLLDDETIRRHVDDYFLTRKLKPENGGSASYLTISDTEALKLHLREKTYLDVKSICAYVMQHFKKGYTVSGMTKWLKANGFRYKKPHGVPAKADKTRQEAFIETYESLKSNLAVDDVIFFVDSSHPQHQTRLAYGWIAKGIRKSEKMTACQKRINLIAGINLDGHHIEYQQVNWVNSENIEKFLQQLIDTNPWATTIHVIWDNARYHKNDDIKAFVKDTKIELHYLPPYSPNLNPIERLWKIMHEQVTYNRYYPKFADFTEAITDFFNNIKNYQDIIQRRINDNFQTLNIP